MKVKYIRKNTEEITNKKQETYYRLLFNHQKTHILILLAITKVNIFKILLLKIIKPIKNINNHIKKLGIKSLKLKTFNIDKIKITKVMRYVLKVEISRQTSLENSVLITKKSKMK